jgi:hypothetical protein
VLHKEYGGLIDVLIYYCKTLFPTVLKNAETTKRPQKASKR